MKVIRIDTPYIKLGQLLKLVKVIETGGQAKLFLAEKKVEVNGERETRRGRKIYPQDIVTIEGFGQIKVEEE